MLQGVPLGSSIFSGLSLDLSSAFNLGCWDYLRLYPSGYDSFHWLGTSEPLLFPSSRLPPPQIRQIPSIEIYRRLASMPSPKNHRDGQIEANRRGRLGEKSSSFYGQSSASMSSQLRRPKTVPDLASHRKLSTGTSPEALPRYPTKLLLNVTMMGSLGPVQVIMMLESTVGDLVSSAVRQYVKECRRPILPTTEPSDYDLHYSQFSLESLDREEKLMEIGSRNFVLCPRKIKSSTVEGVDGSGGSVTATTCSKQADKVGKSGFHWLMFMGFLL